MSPHKLSRNKKTPIKFAAIMFELLQILKNHKEILIENDLALMTFIPAVFVITCLPGTRGCCYFTIKYFFTFEYCKLENIFEIFSSIGLVVYEKTERTDSSI